MSLFGLPSLGDFEIHHLAPELFGGFEGTEVEGYLANPEKALFDSIYDGSVRC